MKRTFAAIAAAAAGSAFGAAIDATVMKLAEKALGDDVRDLVFVPITPCTVWDTRFATEPQSAGVIASAATKKFYSHLDGAGGSFATWGGNPSCPEASESFIGGRPFAVMMTVYVNDATANGWLTLYRDGDADPSLATISVYYTPGPTRTQTVITKSSRGHGTGSFDVAATSRFGSVNASASVTGYFIKPVNIVLPNSTPTTGNIFKGSSRFIHNAGSENTFVGVLAGDLAVSGDGNTGVGAAALSSVTSGNANTAIGNFALLLNTSGANNTALGWDALSANTVGNANTAVGVSALSQNTTGASNTVVGFLAMANGAATSDNTAVGAYALLSNVTGSSNTALGNVSLTFNATGISNTAVGAGALNGNTDGSFNTAVGTSALSSNTTGGNNIAIGEFAGTNRTAGDFNIDIGNMGQTIESNTIRIGDVTHARTFIAGIRGVVALPPDGVPVVIASSGQLGTVSSSAAVKDRIADMGKASEALMKLRPVTFQYTEYGPESRLQYGLIAEEVDKVYPGLVAKRPDGSAETVMYQFLPPMLLNEVQKQQRTIEAQNRRIEALERALERLQHKP